MAEHLTARYEQMYVPFCVMKNLDFWSGAVGSFLASYIKINNATEILYTCASYTFTIHMN